jgi:gliding motility-associated-like protein
MKNLMRGFRTILVCLLLLLSHAHPLSGQLTAEGEANGSAVTGYVNAKGDRDTIFVFNAPRKGKLSLLYQYRPPSEINWKLKNTVTGFFEPYKTFTDVTACTIDTLSAGEYNIEIINPQPQEQKTIPVMVEIIEDEEAGYQVTVTSSGSPEIYSAPEPYGKFSVTVDPMQSDFRWYRFDYDAREFEKTAFATVPNVSLTATDTLSQGGYKVTVTPKDGTVPCDSFTTWVYLNPGFDFKLLKDDGGSALYTYKYCDHTDFLLDPDVPVVQSEFVYCDPVSQEPQKLENRIAYTVRSTGGEDAVTLRTQGGQQYFRDYYPPYRDMQYTFRAYDLFGFEKKDEIFYETIIPHADMEIKLPAEKPNSAPVEVKFVNQSQNVAEYLWRFGDGDSAVYNLENQPPDTIIHTYYTASKTYTAVLFTTSLFRCTDSASVKITVAAPKLIGANVFTPNDDGMNDIFILENESIRQFEISVYTRAGKRVYHYKGNDLRDWDGWDGRIQSSGQKASEGVYFWVLYAVDWNDPPGKYGPKTTKSGKQEQFQGILHLYR